MKVILLLGSDASQLPVSPEIEAPETAIRISLQLRDEILHVYFLICLRAFLLTSLS